MRTSPCHHFGFKRVNPGPIINFLCEPWGPAWLSRVFKKGSPKAPEEFQKILSLVTFSFTLRSLLYAYGACCWAPDIGLLCRRCCPWLVSVQLSSFRGKEVEKSTLPAYQDTILISRCNYNHSHHQDTISIFPLHHLAQKPILRTHCRFLVLGLEYFVFIAKHNWHRLEICQKRTY